MHNVTNKEVNNTPKNKQENKHFDCHRLERAYIWALEEIEMGKGGWG